MKSINTIQLIKPKELSSLSVKNKLPRDFANARRAKLGKPPIIHRNTKKQSEALRGLKDIDYFKKEGEKRYGMVFLRKENSERNKKVRAMFMTARKDIGDRTREMIDWWFDGRGEWCKYNPDNLFTESNIEEFLNTKPKKKYEPGKIHW
jgi:hypothetical protein